MCVIGILKLRKATDLNSYIDIQLRFGVQIIQIQYIFLNNPFQLRYQFLFLNV